MRYHVKGGVWKNAEDEILKAAVMKYGLNQWSRISSLLVRKSAKQCKERWYEWLDPNIKKTDWSKDEEEKLLLLSKMFPCQWKTIGPFVGRTAYQCMEHYEKLLDRAQGRESDVNDPRKLRPGEVDPNPETKPARPDPIDLEEDQQEMLNETRARIINTKGKKAKRKEREKQLEEARRLAALQKKRELKSAGIDVILRLPRKKKKEMNYNADIPFERKVPQGSFDTNEEAQHKTNKFKGAISLQFLENRNRDEVEEKAREQDQRKMKNMERKDPNAAIEKVSILNDPKNMISRNKLILPEPNIDDKSLEGISKLSNLNNKLNFEFSATRMLSGEYTMQRSNQSVYTPNISDTIMREAKIAAQIQESSTPLVGGEEASRELQDFIDYKKQQTNNINNNKGFKTPAPKTQLTKRSAQVSESPLRDELNLNSSNLQNTWETSKIQSTNLNTLLANLPMPENVYEIMDVDKIEEMENELKEVDEVKQDKILDAEDLEKDQKDKQSRELFEARKLYSAVISGNLPRPSRVTKDYKTFEQIQLEITQKEIEGEELEDVNLRKDVEDMITTEMIKLINKDAIDFPSKNCEVDGEVILDAHKLTYNQKVESEKLIEEEFKKFSDIEESETDRLIELQKQVYYVPDVEMYFPESEISKGKKFDSFQSDFKNYLSELSAKSLMSKKLGEKASILTNGYLKRFGSDIAIFKELSETIDDLQFKREIFDELKEKEKLICQKRIRDQEIFLDALKFKEEKLQEKYKMLLKKKEELENY